MNTRSALIALALLVPLLGAGGPAASADPAEEAAVSRLISDATAATAPRYDGTARLQTPAPAVTPVPSRTTCHEPATGAGPDRRYTMCVGPSDTKVDLAAARSRLDTSIRATADQVPVPDYCWDYADRGWVNYRTTACNVQTILGTIVDQRGQPIGTIRYVLVDYAFTSADIGTIGRQLIILVVPGGSGAGLLPGTTAEGAASCTGACDPDVDTFRPQPANPTSVVVGNAYFDTNVSIPGDIGYAATTYGYIFSNPAWVPFPVQASSPPLVRCDNALPGASVGCVFANYIPVMQYARAGLYPELARHIGDAQASGLPGAYPDGQILTRLTDPAKRDQNGNRACPRQDRGGYPRPPTKSCDEYPFRSTYQGAFTADPQGPARTFDWCQIPSEPPGSGPNGYSVCMIDARQNSDGGLSLGFFYDDERVLDRDGFRVWITGTGQGPNPNPPDYPPVADAGPDLTGFEGYWVDLQGSATDDTGTPAVRWSYTAGSDVDPGAICRFSTESAAVTRLRCTDDGTYTVTISADDGIHDQPTTDSATVRLANVTPQLRRLLDNTALADEPVFGIIAPQPWQVFRVGDEVPLAVNFDETGDNDTHSCAVSWDDGTTSTVAATGHTCSAAHRYTHAGMYTIRPTVTDDDGGSSDAASVLVIVYDPDAGFATGGGHFTSAPGSLTADPSAGGKTHFQFNPKYLPHDAGPRPSGGKANLRMQDAGFRFESTDLAWLVVTPDRKVAVAGTGTVNGRSGFGFVLYGYETGHYRLVVWDLATGAYPRTEKVYDNRPSVEYDLDLADPQLIDNGRIQIH